MHDKREKNKEPSCLIVVPTYKECDNIRHLQAALAQQKLSYCLLVIDDGSADGTQQFIQRLQAQYAPITIFQRHKKLGLGSAYILALAYARQGYYRHVVQMDGDMSHEPSDIRRLIVACGAHDIVVGSRYTAGGRWEGWPWHRYLLSKTANWLAKSLLHLEPEDVTAGFRCIRRTFLERLPLEKIISTGFAFQYDFNQLAAASGARFAEVPICFHQRAAGKSKMSTAIIVESLLRLTQIKYQGWKQKQKIKDNEI